VQLVVGPAASWRRRRLAAAIARHAAALRTRDVEDLLDESHTR
jgi:hypothetical protein